MKKQIFNIVVKETENVLGGQLQTTEAMTEKQAMVLCQKIGREYLQNNKCERYPLDVCTEDGEMIMSVESIRFKRGNWESTDYKVWDYRTECFVLDSAAERSKRREAKYREDMAKAQKAQETVEMVKAVVAAPEVQKEEPKEKSEEEKPKKEVKPTGKKQKREQRCKSVKRTKNGKN